MTVYRVVQKNPGHYSLEFARCFKSQCVNRFKVQHCLRFTAKSSRSAYFLRGDCQENSDTFQTNSQFPVARIFCAILYILHNIGSNRETTLPATYSLSCHSHDQTWYFRLCLHVLDLQCRNIAEYEHDLYFKTTILSSLYYMYWIMAKSSYSVRLWL